MFDYSVFAPKNIVRSKSRDINDAPPLVDRERIMTLTHDHVIKTRARAFSTSFINVHDESWLPGYSPNIGE